MMESIKKLREMTGAGMMDVKKALADAGNDEQKAIALLRDAVALAPFRADFHRRLIALCEAAGDGAGAGAARALHEQFGRYRWMRWHRAVSGATILQARD